MAKFTRDLMINDDSNIQMIELNNTFEERLKVNLQSDSVDYTRLADKRFFDEELFQELVEILITNFIKTAPKEIMELRHDIISSDEYYKNKAYSLKLASENLGAKKMVRLLDIIEQGRTTYNNTLVLVDRLEEEFFVVSRELMPFSSWNESMDSESSNQFQ